MTTLPATIPAPIRESKLVTIMAADRVDIIATEPVECLTCHQAKCFFTLTSRENGRGWDYRCAICFANEAKGQSA